MERGLIKNKRKPNITKGLVDAGTSAYIAMIEIHNKPNIEYRYQTCTMLIINAWELVIKAYIYKYISRKIIWERKSHTITVDKALNILVNNSNAYFSSNELILMKANIEALEIFRNRFVHYNLGNLNPLIFGLISKSSILFHDFIFKVFKKDISAIENLVILPIGIVLPYNPIEYLKQNKNQNNEFYTDLLNKTKELVNLGIKESIFVAIDTSYVSTKKVSNAEIIVGIDNSQTQKLNLSKEIKISDDKSAIPVSISDEELLKLFPYSYKMLKDKIKTNYQLIKITANDFNQILKEVKKDKSLCYSRTHNPLSSKSSYTCYYNDNAVSKIIIYLLNKGIK